MNQDQFCRLLLRCTKSYAIAGKSFVGHMNACLELNTGAHTAIETDGEEEDRVLVPPATIDQYCRTRTTEGAQLEHVRDYLSCDLPNLVSPHDHPLTHE